MEEKPNKGFLYWFTNVFWYHYGKIALIVVVLVIIAVWLTVDALHKETYDLNIVVAANGPVADTDAEALHTALMKKIEDVNGDGKVLINIQTIDLSDPENLDGNQQRLLLYLALPEYTLFLLDEDRSTLYCGKEDTFQPLANYGITTDDPNGLRIYVGDKPLMKDLGDYAYYASLSDWTVSGKGSKAMTQAAVNALQVILNTGE
jgi:hypothetical protein